MRSTLVLLAWFVFALVGSGVAHAQIALDSRNPERAGHFGRAVAMGDITGDGRADIIVGAQFEDVGAAGDQGRVYVYNGRTRAPIYTLTAPGSPSCGSEGCRFGKAVAAQDVTGDGRADIIVGAPFEDVGGNSNQGRVYVFDGATGALTLTLNTPNPQPTARFGDAVAAGDVNGDGRADVIVGAPSQCFDVPPLTCAGRVFVFDGRTGAMIRTLNTPSPASNGEFGRSVAAGDVTGDGRADVIVGAPGEFVGEGRVYVFDGSTGALIRTLTSPFAFACVLGLPQCSFGFSVSVGGGGASTIIVIGAPLEDDAEPPAVGFPDQGRVYVFRADGALVHALTTPHRERGCPDQCNRFGVAVAAADLNGDGHPDIIAGANAELNKQGRVYLFNGVDGSLLRRLDSPSPVEINEVLFGSAVAAGDVDGDGKADILAGAFRDDVGGVEEQGRAYLFFPAKPPSRRVVIDFETPSLGTADRRINNPYTDVVLGVTFTSAPTVGVTDAVVGLVKNRVTSACVEPADTNQKLGTGRQAFAPEGSIGLGGFPIRATFSIPISASLLEPLFVSVEFQASSGTRLRLRLFDPDGSELVSVAEPALPADGTCGYPGGPRARKVLSVTVARPVAFALMEEVEPDGRVFVIDNFTFGLRPILRPPPRPIPRPEPIPR